MEEFLAYFNGSEFPLTDEYQDVKERCFELSGNNAVHVSKVLGGVETDADISAVQHVGWWNKDDNQFISALIKNLCLDNILPASNGKKVHLKSGMFEENSVYVITEGFRNMQETDFRCLIKTDRKLPIENALSFRWALSVSSRIANVTLRFQETSENSGYVDFHLNGFANCAIEFIRNATLVKPEKSPQSTDMDAHLARFTSGKYHWQRFFIVNFSMVQKTPVLPSDAKYHDRVFTYVHSTNTLYRGNEVLCKPAVEALPCPM